MTTPTETLTRSQAHRKLLALGMPANVVTHVLDHPDELLHLFSPMPTVVPSKEAVAIVAAYQRHCKSKATTDPLDTVPAEERRRIRNLAREERRAAPWAGKLVEEKAIAREVADYHERTGLRTVVADKAAQVSEDVIGQALTIASGAQAVESLTPASPSSGRVPEALTGEEAKRRLRVAGYSSADANALIDSPDAARRWVARNPDVPATPILRAYVRWLNAHEGIVERAIRLDREATARACGPDLTPAEEAEISASAPGQTPIARAPSTIADAFEAILAFFICLIGPRPHRKITPAEEIGALAACEVETDFTPDSPPTDLTRLRDLIQRAAEEYAQIRAEASKRLDRGDASRRERKAADLAAGPVTEEELAEIEARTSGPGPLAGDGELLRRCAAEIRRLTAKLAGIEGIAAQGDGMMLTISEQGAEIERLTRAAEEHTATTYLRADHDIGIAKLKAAEAEIERLTRELASHAKAATDWRDTAERHLARAEVAERGLAAIRRAAEPEPFEKIEQLPPTPGRFDVPVVQAPPAGSWQAPRCDKGHVARPGAPCPICRRASLEAALHDPETAEGAAAILADMPPPDPRATLHAGDPESGVDGSGVLVPHPANVLASKRGDK